MSSQYKSSSLGSVARACAIAFVLIITLAPYIGAQSMSAAISGIVRDSVGRSIGGASVDARHEPTGFTAHTSTNAAGRYAIFGLPLGGPITVTVRRLGYQAFERNDITLGLGARRTIDAVLRTSAIGLAPVLVRDSSASGRESRIGGSTGIGRALIDALPVLDRNFSGLAALAPLAGTQLSLGGQRWTATDIRLDGAPLRNMLRAGEANGGPSAVPLDAVREVEVNTALFDVTQGRQGGGQIAAVTREGTNSAEGRVFTGYRSERLTAGSDYQGRSRAARQATVQQSGVSFGGPIVRDRAHVFVAYERQASSEPLFSGDVSTTAGEQAAGISRDSLTRILTILGQRYGTETPASQLGRLNRSPLSETMLARIDWQFSPAHRATFRANASRWTNPLSGGVDQALALREARSDFRSAESQVLATLSSGLGAASHNELQIGVSRSRRALIPQAPSIPRGFVQVRSTLPDGRLGNTTVQFGGNRLAPDRSREWSVTVKDKVTRDLGRVLFTAGTDNMVSGTRTLVAEAQSGLFVFPSIAALEALSPNRFTRTVPIGGIAPETRQKILELGAFAQAEWRATNRVAITGGLRWDATAFLSAPVANDEIDAAFGVRTGRGLRDWRQWQPRLQLVWQVDTASRDVVRIGAGRFFAQLPYYAQHNQLLYTGTTLADVDLRGSAVPQVNFPAYRRDPATVPGLGRGALPAPYVNVVGAYRAPRTDKATIAWAHGSREFWSTTFAAIVSRSDQQYQYEDRNLRASPSFTLDNEAGRRVWVPASSIPSATGVTDVRNASANPAFARVIALESNARATQVSLTGELHLRALRHFETDIAYAWNQARDNSTYGCCLARTATTFTPVIDDPRNLSQAWGPSDLDTRHRIVGTVLTRLPLGVTLATRYVGASGRPFSLVVDGDINGDEANGNDLAFLFDPKAPGVDSGIAASFTRLLENRSSLAAEYIRSHLGQIAGRNAIRTPWTHRVDLRLARPVSLGRHARGEVTLDIFNAGNLLNPNWGAQSLLPVGISSQNPVVNRVPLLRVTGFDAATRRYRYNVNESAGVLSRGGDPYQMQLGVRLGW